MEITSIVGNQLCVEIALAYLHRDKKALFEYLCTPRWEECPPEERKPLYQWLIACCHAVNNR